MLKTILLFALLSIAVAGKTPRQYLSEWHGRVVGGQTATPGQFPYQASLRMSAINFHFCGGVIINSRWVVSAAHCTVGRLAALTHVVVGAHNRVNGGIRITASRIVNHPDYNSDTIRNDISVVQTSMEIQFSIDVQPISLGFNHIGGGTQAVLSGWGQTSNPGSAAENLQFLWKITLTVEQCRTMHAPENAAFIFDTTLCTDSPAGQGACMGDSGGPLVANAQVIGIVSWGIPCGTSAPDSYARVSSFRTWILDTIE